MAFGDIGQLQVPTIVTAHTGTYREQRTYDYTGSTTIPCRFFEDAADPKQANEGQELQVTAKAIYSATHQVQPQGTTDTSTGERRQVRIKEHPDASWVTWEVVSERTLGSISRRRELTLRRMKE